jgi:putrescine transport system permease protein
VSGRATSFRLTMLASGFAFLYAPIALLIIYSFNASRLVTVWGGFSTRWYAALLGDEQIIASASVSLRVAALSALIATILGTCAAIALARFGSFRGRALFASMIFAPLVLPEVIIGLSLLLLFVALDIPRGFWTIVAAHATMAMCFVAVVVRERLTNMDRSVEEAAMDLGASPAQTLLRVTLPLAAPSIIAGYMLAFTLSLDDFVLASFTSGPGSTTLPMRVYSQVRLGVSPEINAVSTLMIGFVAAMVASYAALRVLARRASTR